jgi:hypothetical protein
VGQLNINNDASSTTQQAPTVTPTSDVMHSDEAPNNGNIFYIGRRKKYLWFRFPLDPIFSCRPYFFLPTLFFPADPIIFSMRLAVRPYFLRVVAGCCQNGVCMLSH